MTSSTKAPQKVTLSFSKISYSIKCKAPEDIIDEAQRKNYKKPILSDLQGVMRSGQLCAIMGPSGGGKTTLLDVLSGRISQRNYTGNVHLNGVRVDVDQFRAMAGYVPQDDGSLLRRDA
jgi:ATP-binding cassette subfamily G (WHITE) protein 2